jgi:hypothetical protein
MYVLDWRSKENIRADPQSDTSKPNKHSNL